MNVQHTLPCILGGVEDRPHLLSLCVQLCRVVLFVGVGCNVGWSTPVGMPVAP